MYSIEEAGVFYLFFTDISYVHDWGVDILNEIEPLHIKGFNLLTGIGEQVTICLNIGSSIYKEFSHEEIINDATDRYENK